MSDKTIGKVSAKLLNELHKRESVIFDLDQASKVLNYDIESTKKLLFQMKARNLVVGLKAGKYILVPEGVIGQYIGNWYVAAREISNSPDYFISHYSAMDIHNMLTQPLMKVYISSPKRQISPKNCKERFKFVHVRANRIWGIQENWITNTEKVRVSDIERTIIDCLWQPQYAGGITEIAKGIWIKRDKINYLKLLKYVLRFGKSIVAKRLGFILESLEMEEDIFRDLRKCINKRYDVLDPVLSIEKTFKNNWHLRANIDPEEIKNVIRT